MLRALYMLARIGAPLHLVDVGSVAVLEQAWSFTGQDDVEILEDQDVIRNETLLAIQHAMQQLTPAKRELAELYFFHGLTVKAIAQFLGIDKAIVREHITQMLRRLADELAGRGQRSFLIV